MKTFANVLCAPMRFILASLALHERQGYERCGYIEFYTLMGISGARFQLPGGRVKSLSEVRFD